ncbi:Tol-Pal system beta propeller repeat protein TolB [Paenirhodobacter enshiensis]|uniref:Tol-Pal system beta propeller repeat protein TolB n=1 Tax=Paenirhodobacter enshiensis TaxID=1105367 RepID=UPI003FA321B1
MLRLAFAALAALLIGPGLAAAQNGPLHIEVTDGNIQPLPYAMPVFVDEGGAGGLAAQISSVVKSDLDGTGLFTQINPGSYVQKVGGVNAPVSFPDWQAINAQALIVGSVSQSGGKVVVKFRLFDVYAGQELGDGKQFAASPAAWRRLAHKVADAVYSRITGEAPYFDSRVVYVAESGSKAARQKRIAIMDYDGANVKYLTDSSAIVLAPRLSPDGNRVLYTTYETGFPRIKMLNVASGGGSLMAETPGTMTFSPRFSPDGGSVVYSLEQNGNTDLYKMSVAGGGSTRLTSSPSIETAPSFSPDGSRIVFESDRSGGQQLYIMSASGGEPVRISYGDGRYGTPVWSPRGDMIAFTKQKGGQFFIGVMRTDGSEEKTLTSSYLDEGPTWSPNGRVIMFTRESPGAGGGAQLVAGDRTRRHLRQVGNAGGASDPTWGPELK